MSQWGESKVIGGAKFVPDVFTGCWAAATPHDKIMTIILLDDGNIGALKASQVHRQVMERFQGKPYREWLGLAAVSDI